MPLMPELRNGIAFLYNSEKDAKEDANFLAVGFLLALASIKVPGGLYGYLATNYHVIRNRKNICARVNTKTGGYLVVRLDTDWFARDAKFDIAISPFDVTKEMDVGFVTDADLLEDWRADQSKLPVGAGDDLVMISRVVGQRTKYKKKNLAVLRFGNVALCPENEELCFIAEMRSVAGHSGSPVWVYSLPAFAGLRLEHPRGWAKLLGINRGHLSQYDPVVSVTDVMRGHANRTASHVVATNMSMSQVVPAWKIKELLHSDQLRADYQRNEGVAAPAVIEDSMLSVSRKLEPEP